jgi:hypothetical protein
MKVFEKAQGQTSQIKGKKGGPGTLKLSSGRAMDRENF